MSIDYEGKLIQAIQDAQKGDRKAMEHCLGVIEYPLKKLVRSYADFTDRNGYRLDRQELFNEAIVKILEGIGKFQPDPNKSNEGVTQQFISYFLRSVRPNLRAAAQESLRTVSLPDWAVKFGPKIQRAIREIANEMGPDYSYSKLSAEDVAMRSGVPLSRVKLYLKKQLGRNGAAATSSLIDDVDPEMVAIDHDLSTTSHEDELNAQFASGNGRSSDVEDGLLSSESKRLIARSWKFLTEPQKQVLSLRYGMNTNPMSRRDISEKLGMTNFQVRRAERDGLETIRESLEGNARPETEASTF